MKTKTTKKPLHKGPDESISSKIRGSNIGSTFLAFNYRCLVSLDEAIILKVTVPLLLHPTTQLSRRPASLIGMTSLALQHYDL